MRHFFGLAILGAGLIGFLPPGSPAAAANVSIDLSTQRLHVESAGGARYDWPISSAREGYVTPTGSFQAERFAAVYHSKKYDNAPMPHAIFFYYGFAIHGTNQVRHLGSPASHGCVRLAPQNATKLFNIMRAEGGTITIVGSPPGQPPVNAAVNAGGVQSAGGGLLSIFGL
jgi:lipoprotein-anchoring transpeptidase ErfK/SrfK